MMRESHGCGIKTSISRIKDNFSRLTHKSGQIVSLIHDLTKIQFPRKCSKKASNDDFASQIALEVLKRRLNIFGHFWERLEVF